MMDTAIERLLAGVREQTALYEELIGILDSEQRALIATDLERLGDVVKTKETLVHRIAGNVSQLAKVMAEAARALGVSGDGAPTLTELAGRIPGPNGAVLANAAGRLNRLKRRVASGNQRNQVFVQEMVGMISQTVSILTGATTVKARSGYSRYGRKSEPSASPPVKLSREV